MIPFKGKLRFKQYMKDKPAKWGVKVLCWLMILLVMLRGCKYTLWERARKLHISDVGLCTRVVLDLMEGFNHMEV